MIDGQKLRKLRKDRGVTQALVADRMKLSAARVSTIESARRGPVTPDTAVRYLRAIAPDEEVAVHTHVRAFIGDECVIEEGEQA